MGGLWSGCRATRKCTVEESWRLRVADVVSALFDSSEGGVVSARNADGGTLWVRARHARIERVVEQGVQRTLSYPPLAALGPAEDVAGLTFTRPWFGGRRWWLRCRCGRRVAALYLRPDANHFACRTCHNLTYRSVQQHDRRVDSLRKNPAEALRLLRERGPSVLFRVLRAFAPRGLTPRSAVEGFQTPPLGPPAGPLPRRT